jgi:DNA-binding NarL/FixJ family response regulator
MPVTVLLQDPRRLVLEGVAALLEDAEDAEVVLAVTDPAAVSAPDVPAADVAVVSLETDERVLLRTLRALRRRRSDIRVVGTFRHSVWSASGAEAYRHLSAVVAQEEGAAPLLAAIRGEGAAPTIWRFRERACRPRPPALTPRELDVLRLLADGCSAQEASVEMQISRKTVENYKQRVFSKLGVQSQAHAVSTAMRMGALPALPTSLSG